MNTPDSVSALDRDQLVRRLSSLAHEERGLLVEFLRHLDQFDAQRLCLGYACASTFEYLTGHLRIPRACAWRRVTTARLMRRYPVIAEFLADGRLSLKRVCALRKVLTRANHLDLLTRASLCAEDDVASLAAALMPRPKVSDSIRRVPVRAETVAAAAALAPTPEVSASSDELFGPGRRSDTRSDESAETPAAGVAEVPGTTALEEQRCASAPSADPFADPSLPRVKEHRMEITAQTADTWTVKLTVGPEFRAEFEAVKAALSHTIPDGNFEDVFRECFRVTLEACTRRRCGAPRTEARAPASAKVAVETEAPAKSCAVARATRMPKLRSRYIPVSVRREVWARDGGTCAFVSADGKRCGSTHRLDFHHLHPFACGGPSTVENLSLRCRAHNRYEADLVFGEAFMEARVGASLSTGEKKFPGETAHHVASSAPKPDDLAHKPS